MDPLLFLIVAAVASFLTLFIKNEMHQAAALTVIIIFVIIFGLEAVFS